MSHIFFTLRNHVPSPACFERDAVAKVGRQVIVYIALVRWRITSPPAGAVISALFPGLADGLPIVPAFSPAKVGFLHLSGLDQ